LKISQKRDTTPQEPPLKFSIIGKRRIFADISISISMQQIAILSQHPQQVQ
jgi:hypothetical protein